jgi:hypothetical protein
MRFFEVSTKMPQTFCTSISQETPFILDEATSLSEHLLSPEVIPLCGCKEYHTGNHDVVTQVSLFLTSSKHGNVCTGWQEHETDHRNSLNEDKEINSLSSKKCTGSHRG